MALGDEKYKRVRRGSVSFDYAAHDRDRSKVWYDRVMIGNDPAAVLLAMEPTQLVSAVSTMSAIERYGARDWDRVLAKLDENAIKEITARIEAEHNRSCEAFAERQRQYRKHSLARTAAQTQELRDGARLTRGMLESDMYQTFRNRIVCDCDEGDYLDDPAAAYITGAGWCEERRERTGVKLQITLSLDVSNSMWNNNIAKTAAVAFIHSMMALGELAEEFGDNLHTNGFLFAMDEHGKSARPLNAVAYSTIPDDLNLGMCEEVREYITSMPYHAGQDTWITPLLSAIEKWEHHDSDAGAVKLDLVITDGVLEHPTDLRAASEVQERRDGTLRTVLLNFLPEDEWRAVKLPLNCIQYHVDENNIFGMLRGILSEFVGIYV